MIPHLYLISLSVLDVVEMEGWVGEIEGMPPSGYIYLESDGGGKIPQRRNFLLLHPQERFTQVKGDAYESGTEDWAEEGSNSGSSGIKAQGLLLYPCGYKGLTCHCS